MGAKHGRDMSMDHVSTVCVTIFSITAVIMMISCWYRYIEMFQDLCGRLRCIGVCFNFCTSLTWGIWLIYTYANYLCHFNPEDICKPNDWNDRTKDEYGRDCSMHCHAVLWGGIGLLVIGLIELCCLLAIWVNSNVCYRREDFCCFCYFVRDFIKIRRDEHDGHIYEHNIDVEIMVNDIDETVNHFKLKKLDCELFVELDDLRLLISAFIGDRMDIFVPLQIIDLISNFYSMYSQIINKKKVKKSLTTIIPNHAKYALCYRATRDGFHSAAFHNKCDNEYFILQETITFIKTTDYHIIGGYARSSWFCADNEYQHSDKQNNFVFMYDRKWGSFVRHHKFSKCSKFDHKKYGPSFGYNVDLLVTVSDSDQNMESRSIFLSEKYFQSMEIEVFYRSDISQQTLQ